MLKAGGAYLPLDPGLSRPTGSRTCWKIPGRTLVITEPSVWRERGPRPGRMLSVREFESDVKDRR